jgi:uncharacterized repeat protein (TIGR01451 family)
VASGATGDLTNLAEIVIPSGARYSDPNPSNNAVTDTDTQRSVYDVAITKTDGVDTYTATSPINYTIVVSNSGPSDALGITVTDAKPVQIASWGWCVAPCTPNPNANTSDFSAVVNITSSGSIQFAVSALPSGVPEVVSNTANLVIPSGPGTIVEQNPANNSATDVNTPFIDLQITKNDGAGVVTYTPGSTLTYTVVVTNNSTFNLTGVSITDNIPALVTSWEWICFAQNGGASGCDPAGPSINGFTDTVDLPGNGSNIVYNVVTTINAFAAGDLQNTATVNPPAGIVDSIPGNDTVTDTDFNAIGEPEIGPPDGNAYEILEGTTATFYLSQPIVANGDAAPDFIYYEYPMAPGINLDHIIIEISSDGSTWLPIFYWGDPIADTNTNVDINLPNIASACVPPSTEEDNCPISSSDLYNNTGITIDIDNSPLSPVPWPVNYYWIRFTAPVGSGDAAQVDAIQILP